MAEGHGRVFDQLVSGASNGCKPRNIDALRPFLEQIEAHILALAGVTFDPKAEPGTLKAVAG